MRDAALHQVWRFKHGSYDFSCSMTEKKVSGWNLPWLAVSVNVVSALEPA